MKFTPTTQPNENWLALKQGEPLALELMYKAYANSLYNYGSKFTKDNDLVKECIQELFVLLWTTKKRLSNPDNIKNYLYKAFRLSLFKKINKLNNQVSYEATETYDFDATLNIQDVLIADEEQALLQHRLQNTLDRLTPRQREAIFLKFYENLSYEEIAEVMGISVKGAYKVMARAIESLREKLSPGDLIMVMLFLSAKLYR